jgi:hypothetical protein
MPAWLASRFVVSRLPVVVCLAVATGCDSTSSPTPEPSSATTASAALSATGAPPASVAVPVETAKPEPPPGPPPSPLVDKTGVHIDTNAAPTGILRPGYADSIMASGEPAKVVLVDPGAEPRQVAKYALALGSKQKTQMKMVMGMQMVVPGQPTPAVKVPPIGIAIEIAIAKKKDEHGDYPMDLKVLGVLIDASPESKQMADAMTQDLASLKGVVLHAVVDESGRTHGSKLEASAADPKTQDVAKQMQQAMEQMTAPLPDEAIGVGARWQVVSRVTSGADIVQWTTYTLKSRDGKKLELESEVKQVAASSTLGGDATVSADAKIQSFRSGGVGRSVLDLGWPAPVRGEGDVATDLTVGAGGRTATIDTTVKITFTASQ